MPLHRRVSLDYGLLPPLKFDWSLPAPLLLDAAAAQLNQGGVLAEMMVEARDASGHAIIPLVCRVGEEHWVPYIEPDPWDDEVVARFVEWLSVVRKSEHDDVRLQFYSRHPVPEIVIALAQNTPIARVQLEAHLEGEPFAFAANTQRLRTLAARYLETDLPLEVSSLAVLDALISRHLGDEAPLVVTQAFVHFVGCFVGEALVHTCNGTWREVGTQWTIIPTGVEPLRIAVDRFKRGSRAALQMYVPE